MDPSRTTPIHILPPQISLFLLLLLCPTVHSAGFVKAGEYKSLNPSLGLFDPEFCPSLIHVKVTALTVLRPSSIAFDGQICSGSSLIRLTDVLPTLQGLALGVFFSKIVTATVYVPLYCGQYTIQPGEKLLFARFSNPSLFFTWGRFLTEAIPLLENFFRLQALSGEKDINTYTDYFLMSTPCMFQNADIRLSEPSPFPSVSSSISASVSVTPSVSVSGVVSSSPSPSESIIPILPTAPSDDEGDDGSSGGGGGTCFPGSVTVALSMDMNRVKYMRELETGDVIHVGNGEMSKVFGWTHRNGEVIWQFIRIFSSETNIPLVVTASHFVYLGNGSLVTAGEVQMNDELITGCGKITRVTRIDNVLDRGLYNPQTLHGDIVVNDIRVTTFTKAVQPMAAQALLFPLRAAYKMCVSAGNTFG